ncbi:hypothetical protein ACFLXQ_09385 [Chloroflexota bacterium]
MAGTVGEDFARIVALARTKLEVVKVSQEIDLDRAILTIQGTYSPYQNRHNTDKVSLTLTPPWTAEQFLNQLDTLVAEIEQ